jgi:hypothetical protein
MELNIYAVIFCIYSYLNQKISLLEKNLETFKMVDSILNAKIVALENNIKSLEEFRLKAYEKNLIMSREWEEDEDEDEDED